ncbi:MAG: GrpB family protein [bacterium]|nr:GrpB family protein [bacterium]
MKKAKIIGLQKEKVKLLLYNPIWGKLYKKEEKLILSVLKDYISDIQHIGSTAIPGAKAKPIIDIAVGVKKLKDGEKCIEPLRQLGYRYIHDANIEKRHFFTKGNGVYITHHLHVEKFNGKNWKNQILFRDYLKKHKEVVKEYNELKEILADKYKNDRKKYVAGKNKFIKNILKKAR